MENLNLIEMQFACQVWSVKSRQSTSGWSFNNFSEIHLHFYDSKWSFGESEVEWWQRSSWLKEINILFSHKFVKLPQMTIFWMIWVNGNPVRTQTGIWRDKRKNCIHIPYSHAHDRLYQLSPPVNVENETSLTWNPEQMVKLHTKTFRCRLFHLKHCKWIYLKSSWS